MKQLSLYYKHGRKYDMVKHGFTFKEEEQDFEELRKIYYTKEEQEAQDRELKKRLGKYGDIESEIRGK